jgi:FKBP-type peptidyl-prolyl cis-trans isomerase FkpA
MNRFLGLVLLLSFVLGSCERDTRTLAEIEDEQIQAYITKNNLTGFVKDNTGFYYKIISQGSGTAVKYPSYIGYYYQINSINKVVDYEVSKYSPLFNYTGYVSPTSWREALVKINRGGEVRVITPSYLAYGKDGLGTTIPGNTILDTKINVANDVDREIYEDALIRDYLAENNLTAVKHSSGIYYIISNQGTGTAVTSTSATLNVAYEGRLLTGSIFDKATTASSLSIGLSSTIEGWQIGVPLIKQGGKIRLFIPSRYGYGSTAQSSIPANSVLDFDIELIGVTN